MNRGRPQGYGLSGSFQSMRGEYSCCCEYIAREGMGLVARGKVQHDKNDIYTCIYIYICIHVYVCVSGIGPRPRNCKGCKEAEL